MVGFQKYFRIPLPSKYDEVLTFLMEKSEVFWENQQEGCYQDHREKI